MDEMGEAGIARALGRIEANQEASKTRHEEIARTVQTVRDNLHTLRNDMMQFVSDQRDHERRITALEVLPPLVAKMADFGERLKAIEGDADKVAAYMAREEGIRGFLKWAFTAGCGAIGATAAFLGIWFTRG